MKHHTPSPNPKQSGTFVTATETLPARHPAKRNYHRSRKPNHRGLTTFQERTFRTLVRIILSLGGVCNWSRSTLAEACGISVAQFDRDVKAILKRGMLTKEVRRKTGCRNYTNLWKLQELAGGGVGLMHEAGIKDLNALKTNPPPACAGGGNLSKMPTPKTEPAPARQPRPAFSRSAENHPPQMRRRWNERKTYLRDGQRWNELREEKAKERCRWALHASVGTYRGGEQPMDYKPVSDEQEQEEQHEMELWRKRRAEEIAAQAAQAERERIEWAEAVRKRAESMAEPPSAEDLERIERLNRKLASARLGAKSEDVKQRWAEADARNQEAFSDERRNDDTTAARRNHTKNQSSAKQPLTPLSGDY